MHHFKLLSDYFFNFSEPGVLQAAGYRPDAENKNARTFLIPAFIYIHKGATESVAHKNWVEGVETNG